MKKPKDIDSYIAGFPEHTQSLLKKVRAVIQSAAPHAEETIGYGMPGFKLRGKPLVYFAGWEKHIGFYALPAANTAFAKDLAKYKHAKGSIQFPIDKPLPLTLIRRMVAFRVRQLDNQAG